MIARTPDPPYYAVIFTSIRSDADAQGYQEMAQRMEKLAALQPGYLGIESVRLDGKLGVTVSYWESIASIMAWKANADHQVAQRFGREQWYEQYQLRISRVEKAYGYEGDGS